jgi:kynurenine formamidase
MAARIGTHFAGKWTLRIYSVKSYCIFHGIVENSTETVRWLYSKHFAAVAGDTQGFEAWPFTEDSCLYEWLLAHWGTPIGVMWNLEGLSQVCVEAYRWSLFFTSAPLNVEGGVATPPSAIAIL